MEIEIKLCAQPDRFKALKAAVARGGSSQLRLVAHYFDTADGRLAQARAALRVRLEGDRWVQTAKVIAQGPMVRLEHNVDLGPAQGLEAPEPDWQRHAGSPVGVVLAPLLQGQILQATHGTEIDRTIRQVRSGRSRIELALDQGRIVATDASGQRCETPVAELEMELLQGHVADLQTMAARWMARHQLWLDTRSKAERGEALRAGQVQWEPEQAPVWRPETDEGERPSSWQLQQTVLQACLAHALPNVDAVASGNFGRRHVQQAQASLDELLMVWRMLAPLAPGMGDAAMGCAVEQASASLGAWRDDWRDGGDVGRALNAALRGRGLPPSEPDAELPLSELTHHAMVAAMRHPDLQQALLHWMVRAAQTEPCILSEPLPKSEEVHDSPPSVQDVQAALAASADSGQGVPVKAARQHLMNEVERLHKRIRQSGRVWSHLTVTQRDRLRQRCWRVGLLLRWVWPLLGGGAQARLLAYWQLLQRLQAALQAHTHATLAAQRAEALPPSEAVWFERGYWQAELQWLGPMCERELRRLKPFWD